MNDLWVALVSAVAGSGVPAAARAARRLLRDEAGRELSEIERLTQRIGDLEELIDLLRKALDKNLIREGAIASAAEFVIAIVKLVQRPTAEMIHLRDRAQQLLTDARSHISTINQGSRPE